MKRWLLLAVLVGCGSKKEAEPKATRVAVDAKPVAVDAKPIDAAVPDADNRPRTVSGFQFAVTAPGGWTVGDADPVMPGNVMLKGPEAMSASVARMRHFPGPKDDAGCAEAAARLTNTGVQLESSTMTKSARFGDECHVVHHDAAAGQRIVSRLFTVAEDDMLLFMCWFTDAQQDPPPACATIFDSIQLVD